jgi:hypothetical protein
MSQEKSEARVGTVCEAMTYLENIQALRFGDAGQLRALKIVREARELADLRTSQPLDVLGDWNWEREQISGMSAEDVTEELRTRQAWECRHKGED